MMMPKWFDKNPAKTPDDTIADLKASLGEAARIYAEADGWDTAFGHHARGFAAQKMWAAEPGPARPRRILRAGADRQGDCRRRAQGARLSFPEGMRRNVFGIDARQTPDLDEAAHPDLPGGYPSGRRSRLRHTIGMLDDLEGEGGLAEEIAHARLLLFKIKIGGDVDADIARLQAIHALLSLQVPDFRATLDANEQYDPERLRLLLQAMQSGRRCKPSASACSISSSPSTGPATFAAPLGAISPPSIRSSSTRRTAITMPFRARSSLGYRGVSSKSCKGFYKSILNGARAAASSERQPGRFFVSAEDLTCQAGLGIEQDTALVATLGSPMPSATGIITSMASAPHRMRKRCASPLRIPISIPEAGRPHRPCFRTRFSADRFPVVCPRFRQRLPSRTGAVSFLSSQHYR